MKFHPDELNAAAKIRNLEERKNKITQQKAELERKEALLTAVLSKRNRKQDTARKILLGSYVLKLINTDSNERYRLYIGLNKYLQKERDRALFPELELEISNFV
ncbi:MAG: mobilization protein [Geobacteraceae bacterium]|nr:mobilization protein [Geobacteraceae bacterium]NTW81633.1 mobilization protein [Geobacteraceae bacterium]